METPAGPPPSDREAWDHIATQAVRGPLSWIISHLDAMDSDIASQYSPASKKALGNARAASKRLLDMLESLLAAQRISSGMEPLVPVPVGLNAALEPVVKQLVLRATSEGKTYTFASEALGLAATANEDLLRRAVRLVSNRAMDEAQKGGNVRVTASAMSGGITRIRIQATPPAEDSGAVGLVVPAEIGFARMAVEQMGGKFVAGRTAEEGLLVDIMLSAQASHAASPQPNPAAGRAPGAGPGPAVEAPAAAPAAPEPPPRAPGVAPTVLKMAPPSAPPKAEPPAAAAPEPEEPAIPPPSSGFKITREVTFDWDADK